MTRLTVKEAAEYLRLSKATLDIWRTAGKGPRFIKAGKRVLYDSRDLDRWLDGNKRSSTSDQPHLRRRRRRSRNAVDVIG
jgi:excisionase family DNA binding protein